MRCDRLLSRPACLLPLSASSCLLAACLDLLAACLAFALLAALLALLHEPDRDRETKHPGVDGTTNGESHLLNLIRFRETLHTPPGPSSFALLQIRSQLRHYQSFEDHKRPKSHAIRPLHEIEKERINIVLINTHAAFEPAIPLPPNTLEIAGLNAQAVQPIAGEVVVTYSEGGFLGGKQARGYVSNNKNELISEEIRNDPTFSNVNMVKRSDKAGQKMMMSKKEDKMTDKNKGKKDKTDTNTGNTEMLMETDQEGSRDKDEMQLVNNVLTNGRESEEGENNDGRESDKRENNGNYTFGEIIYVNIKGKLVKKDRNLRKEEIAKELSSKYFEPGLKGYKIVCCKLTRENTCAKKGLNEVKIRSLLHGIRCIPDNLEMD
ncbi:hypothetical protein DBV15_11966, partial [Temnothorax longispinosus]